MFNVRVQKERWPHREEALEVAKWIKKDNPDAELILKAQIHAGGRVGTLQEHRTQGRVICDTPEEVESYAKKMLGDALVTHQTGDEGQLCQKVLINEGITIDSEFYFAILMDRAVDGLHRRELQGRYGHRG